MEVEEKKEPKKPKKKVVLTTSSNLTVDQPDTDINYEKHVIHRPEDEKPKRMEVMMVTSSASTSGSRVKTHVPTNEQSQMGFAYQMQKQFNQQLKDTPANETSKKAAGFRP